MATDKTSVRLSRREAIGMDALIEAYIRDMKLTYGLNSQRVYAAWDSASGAGHYTIGRFFKNGTLYCNLSSSAVRQQFFFRRQELIRRINEILKDDPLFSKPDNDDGKYVKNIVLR